MNEEYVAPELDITVFATKADGDTSFEGDIDVA